MAGTRRAVRGCVGYAAGSHWWIHGASSRAARPARTSRGTARAPRRRSANRRGLVEPVRRRGTVVRQRPSRRRITRSRLVYRDELGYYFDQAAQGWRPVQTPSVSRGPVPYDVAALLGLEPGAEVVIRDRVMGDPATGQATQLATSYIPAVLASERPVLSAAETGPGGIYDRLEDAGYGPIRWTEANHFPHARAPPRPGCCGCRVSRCCASCAWPPALPDRPEVNDTRVNAEAWEISYPIARHASTHQGRDASTHA